MPSLVDFLEQAALLAVGGLVAGVLAAVIAPWVSHRLQIKRLRFEYATQHMEKTFIPILNDLNSIKDQVEQGAEHDLKQGPNIPHIGGDSQFRNIKQTGSYEIMRMHDAKLLERIEIFYNITLPILNKVEFTFKEIRDRIISSWSEELKQTDIPDRIRTLRTLHDRTVIMIYSNNPKDANDVPKGQTSLKPLEGQDIEKLIGIAQAYVPEVWKALKETQTVFRNHKVEQLVGDIRKKVGNPI